MFKENKYTKIYFSIIENRKSNPITDGTYTEKHHIIPKSLGGSEGDNLVKLTAREHYICHALLVRMTEGESWYSMVKAFNMMHSCSSTQQRYGYFNNRLYESNKILYAKIQSASQTGSNNSNYGSRWVTNIESGTIKMVKRGYINSAYEFDGGYKIFIDMGFRTNNFIDLYYEFKSQSLSLTSYLQNINERLSSDYCNKIKTIWTKLVDEDVDNIIKSKRRNAVNNLTEYEHIENIKTLFSIFKNGSYKSLRDFHRDMRSNGIYTKSQPTLVHNFKKYIPEYNEKACSRVAVRSDMFKS